MSNCIFYFATNAPALRAAGRAMKALGCEIAPVPGPEVTHLVLPVPSLQPDGSIRGGGELRRLLAQLPENVTVLGGNLPDNGIEGHPTIDLLKDPQYLADNAAITAHCALRLAMMELPITLPGCDTLIIGWGRISQCLAPLLRALGADVTIAARKETDRAMAHALGYRTIPVKDLDPGRFRLIYNTAPAPVISLEQSLRCTPECLKIDLASSSGIAGKHILWARGLPGKDVPETSGVLIAQTILRLINKKEETL